jgi:hypothetical protein
LTVETSALGRFDIPRRDGAAFAAGSAVCVAIRPENLALFRGPGAGEAVPCRVLATAFLGDRSLVQVGVDGADTSVTVAVPHSRAAGAEALVLGTASYLYWRADAVVLLPPD